MNDDVRKAKAAAQRVEKSPCGPDVQRLLDLQDNKGVWEDTMALRNALGGYIPDCPEGVVAWRWATALALAFLRSQPDQFAFTVEAYDRGKVWISPPWLMEAASVSLPPLNNYFPLDEDAVKEGRWRDAEDMLLKNCGYEGFVGYSPPQAPMPEMRVVFKADTPATPHKEGNHRKITDTVRYRSHQTSLKKDYGLLTKSSGGLVDLTELRGVWERPCDLSEERGRLNEPKGVNNQDKESKWKSGGKEEGDKVEARRRRLLAKTAQKSAERQEQARLRALPPPAPAAHHHHHHQVASDNSREVATAASLVVACCEKYDRYIKLVDSVAKRCAEAWRNARLKSERQHSFDELTEMLGPYQRARLGLVDWRAEPVLGVQSITLALIHSVVRWRKALQDAGRPSKPFIWNNKNVLISVSPSPVL